MNLYIKKALLIKAIFIGLLSFTLTSNNSFYAQEPNQPGDKAKEESAEEQAFENDEANNEDEADEENGAQAGESTTEEEETETEAPDQNLQARKIQEHKQSPAYIVLGRKLTDNEKEVYKGLTVRELKDQLLYKEQRLVVVRALLAVGEGSNSKEILEKWVDSKPKMFTELVTYFTSLKEKYGSVLDGVNLEMVDNIHDDKQAFDKAASKAYQAVFGVPMDKPEEIHNYLNQKQVTTYSRMVEVLTDAIDQETKQEMLFRALDEINRPDLKDNKEFVNKLLAQKFTYENLKSLLAGLQSQEKPAQVKAKVKTKPAQNPGANHNQRQLKINNQ